MIVTQLLIDTFKRIEANNATPDDVENVRKFFKLVRDMRHAQKEYFKARSVAALQASKDLEAKVDKFWESELPAQGELLR